MRKLRARVDELERMRGSMILHGETLEKSSKDRLLAAPGVGTGMGKTGLDGSSQEALWLFVRNKLLLEQENGEIYGVACVVCGHYAWGDDGYACAGTPSALDPTACTHQSPGSRTRARIPLKKFFV